MTDTYLFIGDSITDAGRSDDHLGAGYVREIDEQLRRDDRRARVVNRGISGDRAIDLRGRWRRDVLEVAPDLLSVHVGVNDTWRRYDSDDPTPASDFEVNYRAMLDQLDRTVTRSLVLIEPFLVPISAEQVLWRADLDEKVEVVRRLAREFDAVLVPADVRLNALAAEQGAAAIALDGVHPTVLGHERLAALWLESVG